MPLPLGLSYNIRHNQVDEWKHPSHFVSLSLSLSLSLAISTNLQGLRRARNKREEGKQGSCRRSFLLRHHQPWGLCQLWPLWWYATKTFATCSCCFWSTPRAVRLPFCLQDFSQGLCAAIYLWEASDGDLSSGVSGTERRSLFGVFGLCLSLLGFMPPMLIYL